ncbi:MAG: IPTL-CTERM sorting domain-containing protein [Thermodesulfobacteriota bacterium]
MARTIALYLCLLFSPLFTVFSAYAQPVAYIGSNNNNYVSIVDVPTNQIVYIFRLQNGSSADTSDVSSDSRFIYYGGNTVTAIDTSDASIAGAVAVGNAGSNGIAVSPDGSTVYVTSSITDTLTVIRTSDFTVIDSIPMGAGPDNLDFTPDGTKAYVADQVENAVYVIDTASVTISDVIPVPGGSLVRNVTVAPNGQFVYVASTGSNIVTVIDTLTDTVIDTVTVGSSPRNIAFTPDSALAYVANGNSSDVSVIRTSDHTTVDTIPTGQDTPHGADITPDGQFAYITAIFSDDVAVIRTSDNEVIDTISGGQLDGLVDNGTFIVNAPAPSKSIPTLGEWGMMVMVAILGLAGFITLRKRMKMRAV